MLENVKSLIQFIQAFRASPIFDTSSTPKSGFRDDIFRLLLIAEGISKAGLPLAELEDLEVAKNALVKNKAGVFYQGMSLFPTGTFMIESLQKKVMQCRQDQLHQKELSTVGEFARGFGIITKDSIIKKREMVVISKWWCPIPENLRTCSSSSTPSLSVHQQNFKQLRHL